jgi:hypothetical protein
LKYSTLAEKEVLVRCPRCKARFSLQKVFKNKGKANHFNAVAVTFEGDENDIVSLHTNDARQLLACLKNLELEANKLSKAQAKLRMLEGELGQIRKMGWWKRLFWR